MNFFDNSAVFMPGESLAGIGDTQGFASMRKAASARREVQLAECARLWERTVKEGANPLYLQAAFSPGAVPELFGTLQRECPTVFHESMSTSDFASLTDNLLDRALLANFQSYPTTYDKVAKLNRNVKDFRQIRRYMQEGGQSVYDAVPEGAGFNRKHFSQSAVNYTVAKYVAGAGFTWEAAINDDLGIFEDLPNRLSFGGYNSIEKYVTSLYVGTTGLNTSLYTSGEGNIVTSNAALSLTALGTAIGQMMSQVDDEGNPIVISNLRLVVPPGLYVTAMNLKKMIQGVDVVGGNAGTSATKIRVEPWIAAMFEVVMNPWIPIIATTNGATSWYLFASPTVGRPAIEVGFLNGFDTPQLFKKAPNTMRAGGGIDPSMGDFEVMTSEYKTLVVYGGTQVEPKMSMGSNGSGS